jgi:hypothetical protein
MFQRCDFLYSPEGMVYMTNFLIKTFIWNSENTANQAVRGRYGNFAGIVGIGAIWLKEPQFIGMLL